MQRRQVLNLLAATAIPGGISGAPLFAATPKPGTHGCSSQAHIEWAARALERMLTVKPGMTRRELLEVLTTEGGVSYRRQQTYVSRECPLFKVRIEFSPVGLPDPAPPGFDSGNDIVRSISEPFIQSPITD